MIGYKVVGEGCGRLESWPGLRY